MTPLLASLGRELGRILGTRPARPGGDVETETLHRDAAEARRAGRHDEARDLYHQILDRSRHDLEALRSLRDLSIEAAAWQEAVAHQRRLVAAVGAAERPAEATWLAGLEYQAGRAELDHGHAPGAVERFRAALRADRAFLPAAVALGDAHEAAGDLREAVRAWERAVQRHPALPLLVRLEQVHRRENRPSRMIALYEDALRRAPDDLAIALALGRVYLELEMLDQAADQLEKVEVRAPDLPAVHAYLAMVFEHRGETAQALEEYRRALSLGGAFAWPHRCRACEATAAAWQDRCPACGRWNTVHPAQPA